MATAKILRPQRDLTSLIRADHGALAAGWQGGRKSVRLHRSLLVIAFAGLWAAPALAHEAKSLQLGLTGGFLHPLLGPDHLLAMIAVGLWGAFLGRPLVYLLPIIFPSVMTLGAIMAMAGLVLPPVEVGIALSVLLLGLAVLFAYRAPVWLASILVGLFGLFHGYAHGTELPSMADPIAFSLGFVLATGMLHVFGIALGTVSKRKGGEMVVRGAGGIIALAGIYYLVAALG
ncbi:HupE/UreJ family protein [Tsuneonella sp. HG222]